MAMSSKQLSKLNFDTAVKKIGESTEKRDTYKDRGTSGRDFAEKESAARNQTIHDTYGRSKDMLKQYGKDAPRGRSFMAYEGQSGTTENTETTFVNNIPTFVRQTEERVYRSVMIPELRKNVLGTLTSGDKYLARPTDFLTVFSLAVIDGDGNYQYLLDKDVNFMREAYPSPSTSGVPKYYAQFDGESVSTAYGNFIVGGLYLYEG